MNHYIVIVTDQEKDDETIPVIEIFQKRMAQKRWGLSEKAANRKNIRPGDRLIFYVGGQRGKVFMGTAIADSEASELETDPIVKTEKRYYILQLRDVNVWTEPKPVSQFFHRIAFIQNVDHWGVHFQGATRKISEEDYNLIVGSSVSPIGTEEKDIESQSEFVLEKYLEDFIVTNWDNIDFGEKLRIFVDEDGNTGQQYLTDVGYIDILALDAENNFVVIELKKGKPSDAVVGQTQRYMAWAEERLAKGDQKVRGIIIANSKDRKLELAIKPVQDRVQIKLYSVNFQLR